MTARPPSAAQRAEAAIRFFEERGREVVGVTIKGSEFKLEFAKVAPEAANEADLIDMSR